MQAALLSAVVSSLETAMNDNNSGLKRKRLDDRNLAVTNLAMAAVDAVADGLDSLEQMWTRETAQAHKEIERILQGLGSSMPPIGGPTLSPTSGPPSAAPITVPAPTTAAPTVTVDCLVGRTPEQYLLDELLQTTEVSFLLDPAMPQGMAFNFILADTLVRQDVCAYPTIAQRYGLGEVESSKIGSSSLSLCACACACVFLMGSTVFSPMIAFLSATFYYATNGSSWNNDTEWLTATPECQWFGVVCDDSILATNLTMGTC